MMTLHRTRTRTGGALLQGTDTEGKKMKHWGKKLAALLLCAAMATGLLPGMHLSVLAYDGNPYAGLEKTTTTVKFNGMHWYIIKDDSTAVDAGYVTLLAKDPVGVSVFGAGNNQSGYE